MKKNMKRLFAVLLVLCLAFGTLTGCGDAGKENSTSDQASKTEQQTAKEKKTEQKKENKKDTDKKSNQTDKKSSDVQKTSNDKKATSAASDGKQTVSKNSSKQDASSKKKNTANDSSKVNNSKYCYITIICHTLVSRREELPSSLKKLVPSSGVILEKTKMKIQSSDSALDITKRATKNAGIHLSYQGNTQYNTAYVDGINNIYEKDVNSRSGWLYQINGNVQSKGCSAYKVKAGDVITWAYTCNLGKDL